MEKECIVEANADITNASQFNVNIEVVGFSLGIDFNRFRFMQRGRPYIKPRSLAIMCGAVPNRRMQKQRTLEFGERNEGDFLARFERRDITTRFSSAQDQSQFPSHTIDFFDGAININYVKLTISVSRI